MRRRDDRIAVLGAEAVRAAHHPPDMYWYGYTRALTFAVVCELEGNGAFSDTDDIVHLEQALRAMAWDGQLRLSTDELHRLHHAWSRRPSRRKTSELDAGICAEHSMLIYATRDRARYVASKAANDCEVRRCEHGNGFHLVCAP